MNVGWQDVIVLGLVVAAGLIVIRRVWRVGSGKRPPGCATCPGRQAPSERERLISIDPPPKQD